MASRYLRSFTLLFLCVWASLFVSCRQGGDDEAYQEKLERDRFAISNQCHDDADCYVSGCHHSLCRATIEDDFCEHRYVLRLDTRDDLAALEAFVRTLLTEREAQSLRSGGYATQLWTLSLHASLGQRQRITEALRAVSLTGLTYLAPSATEVSEALAARLGPDDRDIRLRRTQKAGPLVEKIIRSGDILSRDDISRTWEHLMPLLNNEAEKHHWDFDIIFESIPILRLWPVPKHERITVFAWESYEEIEDGDDLILRMGLNEKHAERLEQWSAKSEVILLVLGREVLIAAQLETSPGAIHYDLRIQGGKKNTVLRQHLEVLELLYGMEGSIQFDENATLRVERDIYCTQKVQRDCACIVGQCQWKNSKGYNACMIEMSDEKN